MAASRKTTTKSRSTTRGRSSAAKDRSPASRSTSSRSGNSARASVSRTGRTSKMTVDHEKIRKWAESRGGHPACVRGTGGKADTGMIRLDFPGFSGAQSLQEISWDEFFEAFDQNNLALLYQEKTSGGKPSRFNKLVARERMDSSSKPHKGESRRRSK